MGFSLKVGTEIVILVLGQSDMWENKNRPRNEMVNTR
jgi:hypothetical protein